MTRYVPQQALKHIVFDLGAVLFSWQPRQLLMRELPHIATDEAAAAHGEAQIFQATVATGVSSMAAL